MQPKIISKQPLLLETDGWEQYNDNIYGYSLQYPNEWTVETTNYTGFLTSVDFQDREKTTYFSIGINRDNLDYPQKLKDLNYKISETYAYRESLSGYQNPPQELIWIQKNGYIFEIQFVYETLDDLLIFEKIVDSFTFKDSTSGSEWLEDARPRLESSPIRTDWYWNCPGITTTDWPEYGTIIKRGSSWNGVDVYSNGGDIHNGCINNKNYGYEFQCVELIQRFYSQQWNYQRIWNTDAQGMITNHPVGIIENYNNSQDQQAAPTWGDVLVFRGGEAGHVGIVSHINGDKIYFLEQNYSKTGMGQVTFTVDNGIINIAPRFGSAEIIGWLHAPSNSGLNLTTENIIVNGHFEKPQLRGDDWDTYYEGENLNGWIVNSGSIDLKPTDYWEDVDGGQTVDLNGDTTGSLSQKVLTQPLQKYQIRFALAGNPESYATECPPPDITKKMELWWGDKLIDTLEVDSTGKSVNFMGWRFHNYTVIATDAITKLEFKSLTPSCYGPVIDMVTVKKYAPSKIIFNSDNKQDGWILESNEESKQGGSLNTNNLTFNIGDDASNKQFRGILSFNTGAILPDNAVITSAKLKVTKSKVVGDIDPGSLFKGFMVEVNKGFFGQSINLEISDFQSAADVIVGPLNITPNINTYTIDISSAKDFINTFSDSSGVTQIRLRFKLDDNNDKVANYLKFFSGEDPTNPPQLVIKYYIP